MIAAFFLSFAVASEVEVAAPPAAVTVYAGHARVVRTHSATLGAGEHQVRFTGLPMSTMPETLSADVRGRARILGVDYQRITASQVADARVRELEEAMFALRDRVLSVQDRLAAIALEQSALQMSRDAALHQLNAQLLVADAAPKRLGELRARFRPEVERLQRAGLAARLDLRALEEQLAALQRERNSMGANALDTWTAVVHLDAAAAGAVEVDLIAMSTGATWAPRYDVRAQGDSGEVALALSALVTQSTGEDWSQVALSVSSARPGQGTTVPTLDPYWLYRPVVYRASAKSRSAPMAPAPAMAEAPMAMSMDSEAYAGLPMEAMEVAQAQVELAMAATTFTVSRRENIPSTGEERKVLLTTQALNADLREVVVPRLESKAWLVGELVNTADFPLLAGPAGIFLDGAYLGDTFLDTVPPGDSFDVAFGVDDRISVARKPRAVRKGEERVGTKKTVSQWEWTVELENRRRRPVKVEVWEQVPQSHREEVEITLTQSTLAPEQKPEGILRFELELSPNRKQSIQWGYQVVLPDNAYVRWLE